MEKLKYNIGKRTLLLTLLITHNLLGISVNALDVENRVFQTSTEVEATAEQVKRESPTNPEQEQDASPSSKPTEPQASAVEETDDYGFTEEDAVDGAPESASSPTERIVMGEIEVRDQTEEDRRSNAEYASELDEYASNLESGGCILKPFPYSTIQKEITIGNAKEYFYGCKKGIPSGSVSCANGVLSAQPKCNTLGQAKPCGRIKSGTAKYKCYKGNIKKAHENVFGFWKKRIDGAKKKVDFAAGLKEKSADDINKMCQAYTTPSLKRARKNFISAFCKNGELKKNLRNSKRLIAMKNRLLRLAKRAHKKAKSKFKVEFEAFRAQSLWFSRVYISRLKKEGEPLKSCIDQTFVMDRGKPPCFYSSMDIASCIASGKIGRETLGLRFSESVDIISSYYRASRSDPFGPGRGLAECHKGDLDALSTAERIPIRSHEGGTTVHGINRKRGSTSKSSRR